MNNFWEELTGWLDIGRDSIDGENKAKNQQKKLKAKPYLISPKKCSSSSANFSSEIVQVVYLTPRFLFGCLERTVAMLVSRME